MTSDLKTVVIGAAAALGLASTAAVAQQADAPVQADNSQMMQHGDMAKGGMMAMMADPEMRGEMKAMMKNCNKMMARMDTMSSPTKAPRPRHEKS